jgi:hypothetical protein
LDSFVDNAKGLLDSGSAPDRPEVFLKYDFALLTTAKLVVLSEFVTSWLIQAKLRIQVISE